MDQIDVSIVVPVYNEAPNLRPLTEKITAAMEPLGKSYEVLYVDDGSTDGSTDVIRELRAKDPRIKLVKLKKNSGQTAALDAGFKSALGKEIVTLDADLQNDPADIPKVLELLSEYDMVCGIRAKRRDNLLRRITSRIGNYVKNKVAGEKIRDTGCSLKAYRAECIRNLKLYTGMHRFLPTLASIEGFKVTQVLVNHHPRYAGKAKYGFWNRAFKVMSDLLAVRWMKMRALNYEIEKED